MTRTGAERVVVLRALGLGDLLTAVPAVRGLRRAFRAQRLVLAAPAPLAPLVAHARLADEVIDTRGLEEPLDRRLHEARVAVDLHGRGPRSHLQLLATRPGRLIAFACPTLDELAAGPRWRSDEHEVARWCRLLRESGIRADPGELDLAPPAVRFPEARGATVLHPGAASAARRWPAARWAEVARSERRAGRQVVLTGSPAERPLAEDIARDAGLGPQAVLAGRTDVLGLASVVAAAGRLVCGDTGPAHLATAFGTRSVLLFGPTSPALWGPPPGRRRHRVLWAGAAGDPHAAAPHPGLLAIDVESVRGALDLLLREPAA